MAWYFRKDDMPRKRPCVCNISGCAEMSQKFRDILDQRGGVVTLFPKTLEEVDKREEFASAQNLKVERTMVALGVPNDIDVLRVDNRDRSSTGGVTTRRVAAKTKQKSTYIALWHYHPEIFNSFMYDSQQKRMVSRHEVVIPGRWMEENNPKHGVKIGYSRQDKVGDDYLLLPLYPLERAQQDYFKAKKYGTNRSFMKEQLKKTPESLDRCYFELPAVERIPLRSSARIARIVEESGASNEDSIETVDTIDQNTLSIIQMNLAVTQGLKRKSDAMERDAILQVEANKDMYPVLTGEHVYLSRFGIQSNRWHKDNPKQCQELYGMKSFRQVKRTIFAGFDLKHKEPTNELLGKRPTLFEQCLIGLLWIESGLTQMQIAGIFGYKDSTVISRVCALWVPRWGRVGKAFSILPFIDKFTIDEMQSEKFIALGMEKVAYLVDGKDFKTDTSRVDRVVNCAQQSSKVSHSAFRIITWGLPCGLSFEHTDSFFSRAVEEKILKLWAENGRLVIPVGYLGLGDKGFKGTAGYYANCNTVLHPAFLWKGIQFDTRQIGHNLECSQSRYSIETFYSFVTKRRCFVNKIIARNYFPYFDNLNDWAHGRANLYQPLQMPAKHREYFE